METRARGDEQVVQGGVGRACDAPPNATSPPPAGHCARFTHPALRVLRPSRSFLASFLSCSSAVARAARCSLGVAAALSNSRCNIQRLLAVVCGGGSARATKKRAPRGRPEPPTVKLPLLSINRCASGIALSPSLSLSLSFPRNFPLSLPLPFGPYVFIISFPLYSHNRASDIEALMRSSSSRECFSAVLPISAIHIDSGRSTSP